MLDLRQTEKWADYMRNIGWIVERKDGVNYFIRKFPLFGSFMKVQRPEKVSHKDIKILRKKYFVLKAIVEPKTINHQSSIINHGYKPTTPYLPSKTIHIDLRKSEKQLLIEMHHKTRYNIKVAQKKEVEISISNDIEAFAELWKNIKLSRKFMGTKDLTELYKAFGKDAYLLMAHTQSELLAGVLCVHASGMAYYMYAATSQKGKGLYAPTLLVWEQIKLAKKKQCKVFDFEGIYDERFPLKSWQGFTRFKKGFGGKEIEYPGAFGR